nr:aldo/keto reductase [Pseudomonas sp. TTU2014-080ASC]
MVVLQARTNSSRLPAKVMLPIKGLPIAVLAAKRAANTGREVIVATSNSPSDDSLARLLAENGVNVFRGELLDTLKRFIKALEHYDDSTVVVRLTGDNVFPDGTLLDELEDEFVKVGAKYLVCNGEDSGLPYGVSAELTYLGLLREADRESTTVSDREHVTPYIRRVYGGARFEKYKDLDRGGLRCTIDNLDDYQLVLQVFDGVLDPVSVSWRELVSRLAAINKEIIVKRPASKIVLGTAQLGMNYGAANNIGQPSYLVAESLIHKAIRNGIEFIDTARAYGVSEEVIGNSLGRGWQGRVRVVTKLSPLTDLPSDANDSVVKAFVDASFFQSLTKLSMGQIDTLLLHRASHINMADGAVWRRVLELKAEGYVRNLGVSVQTPEELDSVIDVKDVSHIQLPYNLLDWRWKKTIESIKKVKKERSLIVHVRSIYLQGVLLSDSPAVWGRANVVDSYVYINWLARCAERYKRRSVGDLCMSYVLAQSWIDGVVVGVESVEQLNDNLMLQDYAPLTEEESLDIESMRPILTESALNPALWKSL